jgi:hypothetical protein
LWDKVGPCGKLRERRDTERGDRFEDLGVGELAARLFIHNVLYQLWEGGWLSSGNDRLLSSGNDRLLSSGNDRLLSSGNDRLLSSGNDRLLSSGNDRLLSSGNDRLHDLGFNRGDKLRRYGCAAFDAPEAVR